MLWFYLSGLAVLVGAELNAEIEHASPYDKDPGERVAGEKKAIGRLAERTWQGRTSAVVLKPALAAADSDIEHHVPAAHPPAARTRASDWLLGGLVLGEVAVLSYPRLPSLFKRRVER
jgi:hypothetical protein